MSHNSDTLSEVIDYLDLSQEKPVSIKQMDILNFYTLKLQNDPLRKIEFDDDLFRYINIEFLEERTDKTKKNKTE